jgi:hypothetical protein
MSAPAVLSFDSLHDRILTVRTDTATKLSLISIVDALEAERSRLSDERARGEAQLINLKEQLTSDRLAFDLEYDAARKTLQDERAQFEAQKAETLNWIADAVNRVSAAASALDDDKRAIASAVADRVPVSYLVAVQSGVVTSPISSNIPRKHLRVELLGQSDSAVPISLIGSIRPDNSLDRPRLSSVTASLESAEIVQQQMESLNKRRDAALDNCLAVEELTSTRARALHAEEAALRAHLEAVRKSTAYAVAEEDAKRKRVSQVEHNKQLRHSRLADSSDADAAAFRQEVAGAIGQDPDDAANDDHDVHIHIVASGDGIPMATGDKKTDILRRLEALGSGTRVVDGLVQSSEQVAGAAAEVVALHGIADNEDEEEEEEDGGGTCDDVDAESTPGGGGVVDSSSSRPGVKSSQLEPSVRTIAVLIARDQAAARRIPSTSFGSRLVKQVQLVVLFASFMQVG